LMNEPFSPPFSQGAQGRRKKEKKEEAGKRISQQKGHSCLTIREKEREEKKEKKRRGEKGRGGGRSEWLLSRLVGKHGERGR